MKSEVSEDSVLIVGVRRRGRPPALVAKEHMTVYLPTAYIDRLHQLALKHDRSVNSVLTTVLHRALSRPFSEPI